ncbi:MAG: UvrD-helicase domain-containing protein [Zoogloeaceae bacterium]|jgi:ATP-dependent DNA helicase Rep|nr:UvrD-helicase domain-containing protein [Zoogloeaceae bacterium]
MSGLNARQQEAIRYLDGPLLVLAGAGSGKTRVIARKIAYLVEHCGMPPHSIAAITFTNKAAREMRERAGKLIPDAAGELRISTFHALGMRILREEAKTLGYKPGFSIFDATDALDVIADLVKSEDKSLLRHVQGRISHWKNARVTPEAARHLAVAERDRLAVEAYLSYEATLKAYQAVDFDDLILLPAQLFTERAEVREKWQDRLRYLLVDEYQDTNACQYSLLKLLAGARAQFTAVGDDDQSIYGWRGADIENLRRLPQDFPHLKLVKLEQNYRSTVRILKAANNLIAHNDKLFEKKLWSELGHGEPVRVTVCPNNEREAESVVMRLRAHWQEMRGKRKWSDYAILYRSNHLAKLFEQQLRNHRIPYVLSGGQSFFERTEIRDILAYLRLIANTDDDPAFLRAAVTPKRGIGAASLQALGAYAGARRVALFDAVAETGFGQRVTARQWETLTAFRDFIRRLRRKAECEPARTAFSELLAAIGYEAWLFDREDARAAQTRWANVGEFAAWLGDKGEEEGKNLLELTQSIALMNRLDKEDSGDIDAVRLSTLHAAKGLEYPHVFLVGVEEGILPHRESIEIGKVEEERRLMYVGITRARQSLHITYCERRRQNREWLACAPSRFIAEMGEDVRMANGKQAVLPDRAFRSARLEAMKAMLAKK